MFLKNKYTKLYFKIINNAKKQFRLKDDNYFELHHIIPRSFGGNNYKKNLVLLTPKEHFICHLLLTKSVTNNYINKAKSAFNIMTISSDNQKRYNSRLYSYFQKQRKFTPKQNGKNNSNYNYKWIKFDLLNIQMKIPLSETFDYIDQGWEYGRNMKFLNISKKRKKYLKEKKIKKFHKDRIKRSKEKYLSIFKKYQNSKYKTFEEFCKAFGINSANTRHNINKYLNLSVKKYSRVVD